METLIEKVAWRRRGSRTAYVGSVRAGETGLRLAGRDPMSGIDVTLWIPSAEIASVYVSPASSEPDVVVDLDDAEPIFLRPFGAGRLHAQLLARKLDALVRASRVLVPGG